MSLSGALRAVGAALLLLLICCLALMVMLVPAVPGQGGAMAPDLVLCILCFWVLRRPHLTPLWLIVVIGGIADLMMGRPVGLGALMLLAMTEILRNGAAGFRAAPFAIEWGAVAIGTFGTNLVMLILLWASFAEVPSAFLVMQQALYTALTYPVIAFIGSELFRFRYPRKRREGDLLEPAS